MTDLEKNNFLTTLRSIVDNANKLYFHKREISISLFEGIGGLVYLNYFTGILCSSPFYIKISRDLILHILSKIEYAQINDYYSFANGLSGLCWLIDSFREKLDLDIEIDKEIDKTIADVAQYIYKLGNPDFLYGGGGALYYLAQKDQMNKKLIEEILTTFKRVCKYDDKGIRFKNNMLKDAEVNEYDIGYAHGLSGYITILSYIYSRGIISVKEMISDALKYIESYYNEHGDVCFHGSVLEGENSEYKVRLGWCYGDLSIACMYMNLAKYLNHDIFFEKAYSLALHTTKRSTPQTAGITDLNYCHGASNLYSARDGFVHRIARGS
ncbi:MAG: hypothetical protein LBL90_09480 [Prevotellaceae bacterium]|nr:hypothetical protein [Prevotellaceae bacterium]